MEESRYVDRLGLEDYLPNNRSIEFYLKADAIKKGVRIKNDRRVFWETDYIYDELKAIKFLSSYGKSVSEIGVLAGKTKYNLRSMVRALSVIVEEYVILKRKESEKYDDRFSFLITNNDGQRIVDEFCLKVREKGMLSGEALEEFKEKAWYLPKEHKTMWKKREKVPQEIIDLMNGKTVKMKLNAKDWRFCKGTIKEIKVVE